METEGFVATIKRPVRLFHCQGSPHLVFASKLNTRMEPLHLLIFEIQEITYPC